MASIDDYLSQHATHLRPALTAHAQSLARRVVALRNTVQAFHGAMVRMAEDHIRAMGCYTDAGEGRVGLAALPATHVAALTLGEMSALNTEDSAMKTPADIFALIRADVVSIYQSVPFPDGVNGKGNASKSAAGISNGGAWLEQPRIPVVRILNDGYSTVDLARPARPYFDPADPPYPHVMLVMRQRGLAALSRYAAEHNAKLRQSVYWPFYAHLRWLYDAMERALAVRDGNANRTVSDTFRSILMPYGITTDGSLAPGTHDPARKDYLATVLHSLLDSGSNNEPYIPPEFAEATSLAGKLLRHCSIPCALFRKWLATGYEHVAVLYDLLVFVNAPVIRSLAVMLPPKNDYNDQPANPNGVPQSPGQRFAWSPPWTLP